MFNLFPSDIALPVHHLIVQVRNGVVSAHAPGTQVPNGKASAIVLVNAG